MPPLGRGLGAGTLTITGRAPQGSLAGADPSVEEEPRINFNHLPSMIREGARGRLVTPRARSRRKGGKGTGSRHHAGRLASSAKFASGAARKLGTLKVSNGGGAGGSCFLGDSGGLPGGILRSHSQKGEQWLRNCENEVLTHPWRSTSCASMVRRGVHCNSQTPSSCGERQSPRGTDPGAQHEDQRMARMKKRPGSQPQGRQA